MIVAYQDLVDLKVIKKDFPLGMCKKTKVEKKVTDKEAEAVRQKLIAEFPDVIKDELPNTPIDVPPVVIKLKDGPSGQYKSQGLDQWKYTSNRRLTS